MGTNVIKFFNYGEGQDSWTESTISGCRMAESGFWILKIMGAVDMWNLLSKQKQEERWLNSESISTMKARCKEVFPEDQDFATAILKNTKAC